MLILADNIGFTCTRLLVYLSIQVVVEVLVDSSYLEFFVVTHSYHPNQVRKNQQCRKVYSHI